MGAAAFWSFVGASALVLGALAGLYLAVTSRIVGLVMGFGAGTLIAAVAYDLVAEAFAEGGRLSTIMGLSAGALLFWGGDWLLERRTGGDDPVVEATVSGPSLVPTPCSRTPTATVAAGSASSRCSASSPPRASRWPASDGKRRHRRLPTRPFAAGRAGTLRR